MCGREHHDGVSAKWEALLRCRRHRAAVQQMRGELQVHITPSRCNSLQMLISSCILQMLAVWCTSVQHAYSMGKCRSACSGSGTKSSPYCSNYCGINRDGDGAQHLCLANLGARCAYLAFYTSSLHGIASSCAPALYMSESVCRVLALCSADINDKACILYWLTVTCMSCQ